MSLKKDLQSYSGSSSMDGCDTVAVVVDVAVVVVAKGGDNDLPNAVVVPCQKFFGKKLFFQGISIESFLSFKVN